MKNIRFKIIALMFAAALSLSVTVAARAEALETEPYYFYTANYKDNILLSGVAPLAVNPADAYIDGTGVSIMAEGETQGYDGSAVYFEENASLTFEVDVPQAGGYTVDIDYLVPDTHFFNLVLDLSINGAHQFYESYSLDMPVRWADVSKEYIVDEFGNDVYPKPMRLFTWENRAFNSKLYELKTPFVFYFEAGVNTVTIKNNEIPFLLGRVTLRGLDVLPPVADYMASHSGKPFANEFIIIEGEDYSAKSQSYIISGKSSDPNATPYTAGYNRINCLEETSWYDAGNYVEYTFEVHEDALYYLCFKYQARRLKNKPNFKNIYIDGEPLFDEMKNYLIAFAPKRVNEILNVDGENIPLYLTQGTHVLRIESTADVFYESYENLVSIINEINDLSIQIQYITGNKSDKNREWNIDEYIPTITDDLNRFADMLETEYNRLLVYYSGSELGDISNLMVARRTLLEFTQDLDMMVNNLDRLSQGSSAVTEFISLILPTLLYQNMEIEKIYVTGDVADIPKPNLSFFPAMWESMKRFFLTFTISQDQSGTHINDKLNIWVGKNMMHVELMREKFADFSRDTGIDVNLSAMPDEEKLLLSVSAGSGPDMVIGASNYRPFDFALRGAIYDLRQFSDFSDILDDYNPEMFVPFIINDSCYAVPEAVDFITLYYRKDILNKLGLEVPVTWDDVIRMLPELSRFGMSFNTPIANAGGQKHFGTTVPFIQQFNGKIYSEDGSRVELGDPNTVAAFKLMTDLYTRYSMPENIPSFYNSFKRGVSPIGMASLQTYYLLRFGAPELSGQWSMAPSIGVDDGTGYIANYQASVASCSMIMASTKRADDAWTALKWWMEADTQLNYANDLQLRFGSQYIYNTANMKAFARMKSMPEDIKAVVLAQLENTREIPRNPAYFQVERSLSNAWNQVVFQGVSPRTALDNAIITSNREIVKKLKEFGYMDEQGNLITPFESGTREKVESWKK